MKKKLSDFLRTPYGKLAVAGAVLVFSWAFLLIRLAGNAGKLLPSREETEALRADLQKSRAEYDREAVKARKIDQQRAELRTRLVDYWQKDRDGEIETALRERLQKIAADKEIQLSSLGSVRTSRINNELSFAEIDISLTGQLPEITKLLAEIALMNPRLSWRRFDIRPVMQRPSGFRPGMPPGAPAATSDSSPVGALQFSGLLRVIVYEGKPEPPRSAVSGPTAAAGKEAPQ